MDRFATRCSGAFGILLIVPSLATASLPQAPPQEAVDLELSPAEAFPLQEIAIHGLPEDMAGLELRAVPLDAQGGENSETIPLYAVRLNAGGPVFPVPPHPAGLDAGGRFRVESDEVSIEEPLILRVKPLPSADGETEHLLENLGRIADALTTAGGGELARLRDGPIEEVPLHLFSVALTLRVLGVAGEAVVAENLVWADRWLATRPAWSGLSGLADRLAALPAPPVDESGSEARGRGFDSPSPGTARLGHGASHVSVDPFRFASTGTGRGLPLETTDAGHAASRPPWEKVDICSECPGALNHWMKVQSEMAEGYGNLAERMARDRDLFDFVESLKGPAPDRETEKMTSLLSNARSRAKKAAGNPLKNLKTPNARRGLALLEAVVGVAELTFDLNDKFLASLLPSELLPASGSVRPSQFNEDDKRAEPGDPDAASWRMRVTARSGQLEFTARELLDYFSRLKSVVGNAETAVFEDDDPDTKHGLCVPAGVAPKDTQPGTGEAACELAGQLISATSKAVKNYEKARKGVDTAQDAHGAEDADRLPEANFETVRYGPYVWPGINVSNPKWSTARALGACVRVMVKSHTSASETWTDISYSPADPAGSWGSLADLENPPDIGIKPAAVGDCEIRLATRGDRFGNVGSVHLDLPVGVDEITVQVDPNPITVEPGEDREFQATVRHADTVNVAWSAATGRGREIACESGGNDGRPCYRWTAPDLNQGECRRPMRIEATSLARRGLRVSGQPPREGFAAVEVVDPNADMRIAHQGSPVSDITLDPEERATLVATGPAAQDGPVRWTASAGSIGRTGRRTNYVAPAEAGTYRITASSEKSASCTPSIIVTVVPKERPCYWNAEMTGTIDGAAVRRSLSGESVSPGYGMVLGGGRIMGGMGLGQAPGSEKTDGLTFFLDGPLERRSYKLGVRERSGAIVSTRETPWGNVGRGEIQITLLKPDTLIVGGFAVGYGALAAPDFGDAEIQIQGEFVWSPSCPTFWDQMRDLGERTDRFLESRDIQ